MLRIRLIKSLVRVLLAGYVLPVCEYMKSSLDTRRLDGSLQIAFLKQVPCTVIGKKAYSRLGSDEYTQPRRAYLGCRSCQASLLNTFC